MEMHPTIHTVQLLDGLYDDFECVINELKSEQPKYSDENLCKQLEALQGQVWELYSDACTKMCKDSKREELERRRGVTKKPKDLGL